MKIRFETDRLRDEIVFGEDDDDGDGRARRMGNVSGARARVGARSGSGRFAYARYGRRRAGPSGRARASRRVRTFRAPFSRVPVRRHFDVVKVHRREKGPRERASAEARGRNAARLSASDARRGRREGGDARDDGLAGRRAGRARPPRPPAPRAGKGGKARMMAARKAADLGSRRVPSPFETCALRRRALSLLRSRKRALALLSGSLARVLRARGVTLRPRGSRERVSFSPIKSARSAFRKYRPRPAFRGGVRRAFDRRTATATVRGSVRARGGKRPGSDQVRFLTQAFV